jgi:shikimate kinase
VAGNIYLIGPMGAGKTAVGRQLARMLGARFLDCDAEIEKRTGVDIPYIFDKEGEAGFREREKETVAALSELHGMVIATGGGAVLDPDNRIRLRDSGTVIYLRTSVDEQLDRTSRTRHRPLLAGGNRREVLEKLMAVRAPLYEELADITLETTGKRVRAVAAAARDELVAIGVAPLQKP